MFQKNIHNNSECDQISKCSQRRNPPDLRAHIRRTDNLASIRQSPIELFYQKLDEKIKEDGKVAIYLATDSEEVKREMKERYGDRIFCSGKKADRGSLEGIREGITDMYTLARTQKIYGSFQSSFSDMAAQIGGVPLEILKL